MDFMNYKDIENLEITEFDSKQWAQQHSVRMTKMLGQLYVNDVENKTRRYEKLRKIYDKSLPETNRDIPIGAHVLIRFPQAPGTSKLMSNWKGIYVINQQVDKNVYLVSHLEGQRRKMLVHKSRIRLLPSDREMDSVDSDSSVAVAEKLKEQKIVPESGQLRKQSEHPTEVTSPARDHSDNKHFDPGNIPKSYETDNHKVMKKENTKKIPAPNQHGMTLRKRLIK